MPFNIIKKNPTAGEVTSSLTNASDAAGLHFDGAAGNIDIASPPDLGAFAVYINNGAGYPTTTTAMTVDELSAEIPAGTVLTFREGGEYIVTTTAAAAATSIVSTSGLTGAAVADNEGAAYGGANKFSFEFIIQADSFGSAVSWLIDFGNGGRFIFGSDSNTSYNLGIYDNASWKSLGIKVLDDLKVHHLTLTVDGTSAILYDNGNQVGTKTISASHGIDNCADAKFSGYYGGGSNEFNGTIYRARLWNKTLSQAEVTASYENATVPFADQYGSQTETVADYSFSSSTLWSESAYSNTVSTVAAGQWSTSISAGGAAKPYVAQTISQITTPIVAGKKYRAAIDVASISSGCQLRMTNVSSETANYTTTTAAGLTTYDFTGWQNGGDDGGILVRFETTAGGNPVAGAAAVVNSISIVEIGCVADYDLAFANPTQSTMVQDRAGAADGTSSATGVVQVTPIEQLNSKSARIGTSAATPADGQVLVDGGAAGTPAYSFGHTTSTGMYSPGANQIRFSTASTDRLTIASTGLCSFSAGIASTRITKDGAFDIASTTDDYDFNTGTGSRFKFHSGITGSRNIIGFSNPNGQVGAIETNGSATAYNTSSDYRLKENVTPITGALDRLDSIPVYNFNFKADSDRTVDGFLAHEVAEFVPEAITGTKDEMQTVVTTEAVEAVEAVAATLYVEGDELPEGKSIGDEKTPAVEAVDAVAEVTEEQPKYQGIDQSKLVPLLVAAVKELKAKVTALENA
jgi:hypothetical protein